MGMNYYAAQNFCECCKRSDDLHIGKSSWGWEFSFRGYRGDYSDAGQSITSWDDWKEFLLGKMIRDEDGKFTPYQEFVEMIEGPKAPGFTREDGHANLSHNDQGKISKPRWFDPNKNWYDPRGYSFSDIEFS